MGVFCTCGQTEIYSKGKIDLEINSKISNPKNISNKAVNIKSKYKEKHLTKDSTLVNYSNNNNSPDYHETNKVSRNNLSELCPQNNSKNKETKNNIKYKEIEENRNSITQKIRNVNTRV